MLILLGLEKDSDLLLDEATQQLIQSVLGEQDKATVNDLEALNQQCDQLRSQIRQLAWMSITSIDSSA